MSVNTNYFNSISIPLKKTLERGFEEDIGFGDITTGSVLHDHSVSGFIISKADGVISGTESIPLGYRLLDESASVKIFVRDGESVQPGVKIAKVEGPTRSLLTGERVILNILQHMSGISTATAACVKALEGSNIRVCDTRKTLPGLRPLQKYAVRCGGGYNHRLRLDDGVMIKDNHIAAAGSITKAVQLAKDRNGLMVKIEVECETQEQVDEAVAAGADIIMLDNQTPDSAREICKTIPDSVIVELSGGITPETIGNFKDCGAHYISTGFVTHSAAAFDISFVLSGTIKNVNG